MEETIGRLLKGPLGAILAVLGPLGVCWLMARHQAIFLSVMKCAVVLLLIAFCWAYSAGEIEMDASLTVATALVTLGAVFLFSMPVD